MGWGRDAEVPDYRMTHDFNAALFKVLRRYLAPQKGDRILDMGCGRGFYVRALAGYAREVIGVDISDASLEEAVTPNVRYGDVTALEFNPASFDKVYSLHTIEHLPEPSLLIAEMARVLKPGGMAVVVYPWEPFRGFQAMLAAWRQYRNPFLGGRIHLHRLTPARIKALAEGSSLSYIDGVFTPALGLQYLDVLVKRA